MRPGRDRIDTLEDIEVTLHNRSTVMRMKLLYNSSEIRHTICEVTGRRETLPGRKSTERREEEEEEEEKKRETELKVIDH